VLAQTPVFGGPGLGFDVIRVVDKEACMRILSTTEDGSFLLVELAENKAGWVASGTVDSALSASADGAVPAEGTFVAVRELVLRAAPRFDASVVGASLAPRAPVTRKAVSVDGQWFLVVEPGEGGKEGWVPKYHVALAMPEEGAPAAATSTEGWGAARLARKPASALTPPPATPPTTTPARQPDASITDPTVPTTNAEPATTVEPNAPAPATDGMKEGEAPASEPSVEIAPTPALLGRTQELSVTFGYRYWLQSYTSDAQQDPYFKYELSAPIGFGLSLDYGWRGELPVVVDVRAQLGFNAYETLHIDNAIYSVVGTQLSVWPRVAWRLHGNEIVDVDAGLTMGLDGLMNYTILLDDTTSSTLSGFYFGAGPSIAARSRLGGGEWGLLVMEASIPVGGYTMVPDPGARYTEYAQGKEDVLGDPGLVYAEVKPPLEGEGGTDAPTPGTPLTDGANPLHLMVGADGRVRYMYAFSSLWRVECGGAFTVRQALIAGPGRRNGSYSEAANIDMMLSLFAGVSFGL
jgi:hypothetical protein